jgi:hypothetical protein
VEQERPTLPEHLSSNVYLKQYYGDTCTFKHWKICWHQIRFDSGNYPFTALLNQFARKEKVQKDKQRSTKHTHKTKDRVTRAPLNTTNV